MEGFTWDGLFLNLTYNLIWAILVVGGSLLWIRYQTRRRLIPVDIKTRKVSGPESGVAPKILIATFSGYPGAPKGMSNEEYATALRAADLGKLPLNEKTLGIGHTLRSLSSYRDSLEEVYLITSLQSRESVDLLRSYAVRHGISAKIHAQPSETLRLEDDAQVTERTHEVTRDLLIDLRKRVKPKSILVDVTGGTRSMTTGALLACLIPDQDAQVIAAEYTPDGRPDGSTSFPLVIQFNPDLRALRELS